MVANNETIKKVGRTTCETQGKIEKMEGTVVDEGTCTIEKKGQVRWGDANDIGDGDSGSLAFDPTPDTPGESKAVSLCNGWSGDVNTNTYVFGTAIYRIGNKTGYYVPDT